MHARKMRTHHATHACLTFWLQHSLNEVLDWTFAQAILVGAFLVWVFGTLADR
jgi:hypothetical protein